MTLGIDKHGSLVWEAGRHDGLARYITFALTAAGGQGGEAVLAELIAGADDGERFTTMPLLSWPFTPDVDFHNLQKYLPAEPLKADIGGNLIEKLAWA